MTSSHLISYSTVNTEIFTSKIKNRKWVFTLTTFIQESVGVGKISMVQKGVREMSREKEMS